MILLTSTAGAITFAQTNNPVASYTVTYTPSGGTAATDVVTAVTPISLTGAACTPSSGASNELPGRGVDADHGGRIWWDGQHCRRWRQPHPTDHDPERGCLHNARERDGCSVPGGWPRTSPARSTSARRLRT